MLDILPLASLQLYERHVERLVKLYPTAWHLVVLSDEKARGGKWARVRLRISTDIAAGKAAPELWDAKRPWVAALHQLVGDTAFWEDQVRSPANAWVAAGGRGAPRAAEEVFTASQASGESTDPTGHKKTTKEKRAAKKRKVQAEKDELKNLRAITGGKGKQEGKGTDKAASLKSKDQDLLIEPGPPQPGVPAAIVSQAGLEVTIESYDLCKGDDLTDPALVREILRKAEAGKYHGPVRSRQHIYGLPSNTRAQQDEADRGTLLEVTTVRILEAVERNQAKDSAGTPRTVSIENPPETNHPFAGSAYYLPEIVKWTVGPGIEFADFNNCVYADPAREGQPYKKPQRFVGKLRGLSSLTATCTCGKGAYHPKVVGEAAAKDSAGCPIGLCHAYAKLVVKQWTAGAQPPRKRPAEQHSEHTEVIEEAHWTGGPGRFGSLRLQDTKKARSTSCSTSLWRKYRAQWQQVSATARNYIEEWMEAHFGVCSKPANVQLKSLLHYDSPVNVALLEAWSRQATDPDQAVLAWLREGAPLGANVPTPSVGIFPSKEEDPEAWEEAKAETQAWEARQNYGSFTENPGDSEEEMKRLMDLGYVKKITEEQARNYFSAPVISKLGLLVKTKTDGTVKRRVIVDAPRSGANRKARCPERIVLPRPQDVYAMGADLKAQEPQLLEWYRAKRLPTRERGSELVAADLTDAFTHFPVHPAEHEQCLSPAGDGKNCYVFVAMFFGHKCAPLIMCRLSALLTRLLQGMFWQAELQLATYLDDPLTALVGSRERRVRNLSLVLLTLGALGIRLACTKGREVPQKLRDELLEKLDKWASGGMIPVSQLRTFAGKLTWAAGIYRRARWAVSIVYGAIAAHENEIREGTEATRRAARPDSRPKDFLIPVKRFELARAWLATLFKERRPVHPILVEAAGITHDRAYEYPVEQDDAALLGFLYKSHKSQSFQEALAVFLALREWGQLMASIKIGVAIRSDSTVALAILEKSASTSPALNYLAAEMALLLEKLQIGDLELSHVQGKMNVLADWLSRLAYGADNEELNENRRTKQIKNAFKEDRRSNQIKNVLEDDRKQARARGHSEEAQIPDTTRQLVHAPGPLRQLHAWVAGGACRRRQASSTTPTSLHMGAGRRGRDDQERGGNSSTRGPHLGTGCGIWAHLGPTDHPTVTTHGKNGGHRRQPDFADLALRRLGDDRKHKATLGRSPAMFTGPLPQQKTREKASRSLPKVAAETCLLPATNNGAKFNTLNVARDKEVRADAVDELKAKFYADSNKAFPLTPQLVLEFGLSLQAAGYKSGEQYLGVLKLAHVERDHPAEDFPLHAVIHDLVPNESMLTYCLALAFMLRRCELEQMKWSDLVWNLVWNDSQVTLLIKKSKTDQAAKGVKRTLGCTCRSSPATCPVELVKKLAAEVDKALPGFRDNHSWVACSTEGNKVVKEKLVAAWSRAAGRTLRGHSPRRSGTMFYVRAGLTIAEVTYLGRWHSNLVFQYGEEAWEGRPMNKADELEKPMPQTDKEHVRHEVAEEQPHHDEGDRTKAVFVEDLQSVKPRWVRTSGRSKVVHLLAATPEIRRRLGKPRDKSRGKPDGV
ncbi:unnamed protein product, partial [Symbiodinium necroappetens]